MRQSLRTDLQMVARIGAVLTYDQLAQAQGITGPGRIRRVAALLEALMEEDHRAGRPFLASVIVSKATGQPARGFFEKAAHLTGQPFGAAERAQHLERLKNRP
ncbi:hypothetical protein FHS89_001930 [Rubricella aquisinus]|uniref:Uncharacterized protein n=1 Tax=Rubricella aquisinus TaxID=2028108 RepID=A0A840WXL3_9RHOB|nr:hypothetical protein [Rubricella aquisinus]MBB5515910.1 hypothetical protein [Rubricella aquisinus]